MKHVHILTVLCFLVAASGTQAIELPTLSLEEGENTIVVKYFRGWEGWSFYARIGDGIGLPLVDDGLRYGRTR